MSLETDGHLIKVIAQQIPDTNRWSARVVITWWEEVDTYTTEEIDGPSEGFSSKTEAESWGRVLGNKSIDFGKADKRCTWEYFPEHRFSYPMPRGKPMSYSCGLLPEPTQLIAILVVISPQLSIDQVAVKVLLTLPARASEAI
jgi:hypothetical protein